MSLLSSATLRYAAATRAGGGDRWRDPDGEGRRRGSRRWRCWRCCRSPASAPEPPPNPFVGTWATADNDVVTIRQDTIVQTEPDGKNVTLDKQLCRGVFRFGYTTRRGRR